MAVNGERSALDKDTVNLECRAQQHSILNKIENIFFFFLDLTGKELVLLCLGSCFTLFWGFSW